MRFVKTIGQSYIKEPTMLKPVFQIEDGEVKIYRGDGAAGSLGTLRPNDEQVIRVIKRAYELGRTDKAAELREAIGATNA